ncbi:MAG: amidohydrolase [Candidatus Binatia bacterium]
MFTSVHILVRSLACLTVLATAACSGPDTPDADIVFRNGGVYTVDPGRTWAEAVAVDGDTIVYVGTDAGVEELIGSDTEVVDLEGRMLLPGLQDSHVHPILGGVLERLCRLDDATTHEEILAAARECARTSSEGWVLAFGWRSSIYLPEIDPHKEDLDRIIADRPAVLISKDMHTFWLNSRALAESGISRDTPTPTGGEILRDPSTGEPTGTLRDLAVAPLLEVMPRPGLLESFRLVRATIHEMNRYGYTSLMEARLEGREMAWAYRILELLGLLDARVSLAMLLDPHAGSSQLEEFASIRDRFSTSRIDARIVKIFVDGGTAVRSAATAPYESGARSAPPYIDADSLARYVREADSAGFAVHLHTLGDRATHIALDAIAGVRHGAASSTNRHAITHLVYPDPRDLPRLGELDVIANISPYWAFTNEWSASFPPVIGEERTGWMYPFRALSETNAILTAGSDYPFTPLNPFLAIEVGMTRQAPLGPPSEPLIPDQALLLEELLAAYTINAAYQLHQEQLTGSIEVGKAADLIVLDRNLFDVPPTTISETTVLLTLLAGEVVFRTGP